MPITVIIKNRFIAKNEENMEILELWEAAEISVLADNEKENILNEANIKKLKGNLAYIKRWFEDHEIHIGDAGQNIVLAKLELDLDSRAHNLYEDFNKFLNIVAEKMGLDATMDAGTTNPKQPLSEPYGLIKTILLRMVLKILHNKGGIEEKSKKHEKVFNTFMESLTNTDVNLKQGWIAKIKGEVASKFSSHFLREKDDWSEKINLMIDEVGIINLVKNVVESNIASLRNIQLHTARFLYLRLLRILNIEIGPEKIEYFNDDWVFINLPKAEQGIMELYKPKDSLSLQIRNETHSRILITRERQHVICKVLLELKNQKKLKNIDENELAIITDLYNSLYNITFIKEFVEKIDTLTTYSGCLPFLMRYVNAKELTRYIKIYKQKCLAACTDKGLEKTIIHTITGKKNKQKFEIKTLPFDLLENEKVLESMSEAIFGLFQSLSIRCHTHQCPTLINEQNQFLLPNTIHKQPLSLEKAESSTTEKHATFTLTSETAKNSLLSCLGLENADLIKLLNHFKEEKNTSWNYVGQEIYFTLQGKELPHGLQFLCRNIFDVKKYHEPFEILQNLARELRNTFMENNINIGSLPKLDEKLIEYAAYQDLPFLAKYKDRIKNCRHALSQSNTMLAMAFKNKDFVLAYFQFRYIEESADLEYIPNMHLTIKAIAEFKKLHIIISKSGETGIVKDESNTCDNPEHTIHINFVTNTITHQPIISEKIDDTKKPSDTIISKKSIHIEKPEPIPESRQDKTKLYNFLFEVVHTRNNKQKQEILEYFITDDTVLASHGWKKANLLLEEAKKSIKQANENEQDFEGCILSKARKYILASMNSFIKNKTPNEINDDFIRKANKKFESSIKEYMNNIFHVDYANISKTLELQPHVNLDNIPLLLHQGKHHENKDSQLIAFTTNHLYYYMKTEQGKYICFKASEGRGDGNCSLTALDIDNRDEFTKTLRNALKNGENKTENSNLLALEIRNGFDGKNGIEDIHNQKEWLSLHNEYHEHCLKMDSLKRQINANGFLCNGTAEDLLGYLNKQEIQAVLTEEDKKLSIELENILKTVNDYDKKLLAYCHQTSIQDKYIEKLAMDTFWIGKYALRIYASEKKFSLFIYDKIDSPQFQELKLDKNSSLDLTHPINNKKAYIVFKNANHFDKLIILEDFSPEIMAGNYLEKLKKQITNDISDSCIPKNSQSLQDYKNGLVKQNDIATSDEQLTPEEAHKLNEYHALIVKADKWPESEKSRDKLYKELENQAGSHFTSIMEFKDQLVLVDEARDADNRTLLDSLIHKGITTETEDTIDFLLASSASAMSYNGNAENFIVTTIKPDNHCVYVLEKDINNQWMLNYYEKPAYNPVKIDIEMIPGLKEKLQHSNININNDGNCDGYAELIKPYHEKLRIKTPLSFVARNMGYFHDNPMYFKLLSRAADEILMELDKTSNPAHLVLYYFSKKFITAFSEHLKSYIAKILERREDFWYRLRVDYFPRENQSRAKDLALIYESIFEALKTYNFKDLLINLRTMKDTAPETSGSDLYSDLEKILKSAETWLYSNLNSYNMDYERYQLSINHEKKVVLENKPSNNIDQQGTAELIQLVHLLQEENKALKKEKNIQPTSAASNDLFSTPSTGGIFATKSTSKMIINDDVKVKHHFQNLQGCS